MEYVIEAADVDDMKSWLATIKYCMRSPPTTQPPPDALPGGSEPTPPDLPPRRDLPTSSSNVDLAADTPEEAELGKFYLFEAYCVWLKNIPLCLLLWMM